MLKWVRNTYDPTKADAHLQIAKRASETQAEAWKNHKLWIVGKVISRPQATETYTVAELEQMNLVGVYETEE